MSVKIGHRKDLSTPPLPGRDHAPAGQAALAERAAFAALRERKNTPGQAALAERIACAILRERKINTGQAALAERIARAILRERKTAPSPGSGSQALDHRGHMA
ncbi:hypothetical protein [Eilatimonas milleporae]|uniref:hypothetical protein n=1 Tax=Eilatimonas milleporae TaxID=911205 RepID=UPI0011C47517|nr:hypothetical protein [Eilatimonas milleporae]